MAKFSHKNRSILYRIINNIPGHGALVKSRWLVWAPNGLYSANSRWIPVGPYWVHMARKCPRWSINMGAYFCPGDPIMDLIWAPDILLANKVSAYCSHWVRVYSLPVLNCGCIFISQPMLLRSLTPRYAESKTNFKLLIT